MEKSLEDIPMEATVSKERCAELERVLFEFWFSDSNYGLQMIVKNFAYMPIKAKRVYYEKRTSENENDYVDIKQRIIADNKRAYSEIMFVVTDYVLNPRTSLLPLNVENAVEAVILKGMIQKLVDLTLLFEVRDLFRYVYDKGRQVKYVDYVKRKREWDAEE